jgi:hypothetical protein
MPYVIVADDAFALHTNVLKPYCGTYKRITTTHFQLQLRARRVVENFFGIFSAVFQVLRKLFDAIKSCICHICLNLFAFTF